MPSYESARGTSEAIPLSNLDFEPGAALSRQSFALPHRLVTANDVRVWRAVAKLKAAKLQEVRERVCATIQRH